MPYFWQDIIRTYHIYGDFYKDNDMARQARIKSSIGIYHVVMRGIDKRDLFLESEHKSKFIGNLAKAKKTSGFLLFGYCLMDNHVQQPNVN